MATKPEPAEPQVPSGSSAKPADALQKELQDALKSTKDFRRATSWEIHRWPLEKFVVEGKRKIHLPRNYRAEDGEDVKTVWAGTDLNQFVYKHYMEAVDAATLSKTTANFVSNDDIISRRHELLGPDPRVAGYSFDDQGEIHIRWWDKFLQDQWVDQETWEFQMMQDDKGQWVEKDTL